MRPGRMHPRVLADDIKNMLSKFLKGYGDQGDF